MTWFLAMTFIFAGFLTPLSAAPSSSSAALLLVANKGDQTLGLVDPDSGGQPVKFSVNFAFTGSSTR
jgi:hypothetical protein